MAESCVALWLLCFGFIARAAWPALFFSTFQREAGEKIKKKKGRAEPAERKKKAKCMKKRGKCQLPSTEPGERALRASGWAGLGWAGLGLAWLALCVSAWAGWLVCDE